MPPAAKQSFLNTALLVISIIGGTITTIKFVAPLHSMPEEMQHLRTNVHQVAVTQAVQTEALKTLTEVAADAKDLRRVVDRHDGELRDVQRRLNTIEKSP